jgi:cation diffusion facilitator CzcD-associated flavoprotein CzcO
MGPDQGADVDILIVGAGVTGIYQLYRACEAGYSAQMLEAGSGVGGTWYWNRYPGARYDSESCTYGYLFSDELFAEWDWTEHFAGQPENERYFIEALAKSPSGFLHAHSDRNTFEDSPEERKAFYEQVWQTGGFGKIITNYRDMTLDPAANAEWSRFVAGKIRAAVKDPVAAEKLIPTDHGYAGKRPPYVADYYEAYNRSNVSLVDLNETPITAITETGIETMEGLREFDVIVWATGFDFGTGALNRLGARGRDGLPLKEYWAGGPLTYLGLMCHHFPNFFFPGGPHGAAGNNPRYSGDQSDFVAGLIDFAREHGHRVIEVPKALEEEWTTMVNAAAVTMSPFNEKSYFFGTNIPGKARAFLLNSLGRPKLLEMMETVVKSGYGGFFPIHLY